MLAKLVKVIKKASFYFFIKTLNLTINIRVIYLIKLINFK